MSLKRKRSSETASPSTANASSPSVSPRDTSPATLPHTFRLDTRMIRPIIPSSPHKTCHASSWGPNISNLNLHSRTQKRLRNNRPPESEVYCTSSHRRTQSMTLIQWIATTHDLLFSAARSTQPIPRPSHSSLPQTLSAAAAAPRQSSLHQFWSLPPPPISTSSDIFGPSPSIEMRSNKCEDCEGPLLSLSTDVSMGGIELDMEYGAYDESELSCMGCGKMVCSTCAVVETGLGRECLECRTR